MSGGRGVRATGAVNGSGHGREVPIPVFYVHRRRLISSGQWWPDDGELQGGGKAAAGGLADRGVWLGSWAGCTSWLLKLGATEAPVEHTPVTPQKRDLNVTWAISFPCVAGIGGCGSGITLACIGVWAGCRGAAPKLTTHHHIAKHMFPVMGWMDGWMEGGKGTKRHRSRVDGGTMTTTGLLSFVVHILLHSLPTKTPMLMLLAAGARIKKPLASSGSVVKIQEISSGLEVGEVRVQFREMTLARTIPALRVQGELTRSSRPPMLWKGGKSDTGQAEQDLSLEKLDTRLTSEILMAVTFERQITQGPRVAGTEERSQWALINRQIRAPVPLFHDPGAAVPRWCFGQFVVGSCVLFPRFAVGQQ